MSMWNNIPPDELARRTKNYGLAGGWLTPPAPTPAPTPVMTCPLCDGKGHLS